MLPMNRSFKATKMVAERLYKQYVCRGLQIESMFSTLRVMEVAELQHFSTHPRGNWMFRTDDVKEIRRESYQSNNVKDPKGVHLEKYQAYSRKS